MEKLDRLKEIVYILKESNIMNDKSPNNVCNTIEKLGPTFIKIGQILSTRVDLLPDEYCKSLSKLRSDVDPIPYEQVKSIIDSNYSDVEKIFSHINKKPLGSASIAQVHKAILIDGSEVVIKIKRPNITNQIKTDIELMKKAVTTLHLNKIIKIIDLNEVLDELYQVTLDEIDFTKEMNHLKQFKVNQVSSLITCPTVYEDLATSDTIVMEYIKGYKINDIESLINNGLDLSLVAEKLSDNYIKQALDDGFFHADPHPDNIIVTEDKIVFIDLGMMGTLNNKNKNLLKKCMKAIIEDDYHEVGKILVDMSTKTDEIDYEILTDNIRLILSKYSGCELKNISTTKFVTSMFQMLKNNGLILDKNITMLIRGIAIIESVLEKLDSSISLLEVLSNRILIEESNKVTDLNTYKEVVKKILKSGESFIDLPKEANTLLKSFNNGETKFKFELSDSSKQVDKIESLVHQLVLGFIDGCLILGFSLIDSIEIKFIFIIFIILISTWLLLKMILDKKHNGY